MAGNRVNKVASHNGNNHEKEIIEILNNQLHFKVESDKENVDIIITDSSNKPVSGEIKTCQKWQRNSKGTFRHGRFILDIEQDKYLKEHNGVYIFGVFDQVYKTFQLRIIPANNIEFKRAINWIRLFKKDSE